MKKISYILVCLFAVLCCTACTNNDPKVIAYDGNSQSGVLASIDQQYVMSTNPKDNLISFKWTPSDFGYEAAITYSIDVDLAGHNFANAQSLIQVPALLTGDATVGAMQKALQNLQEVYSFKNGEPLDLELRLKSSIGPTFKPVYSNTVTTRLVVAATKNK